MIQQSHSYLEKNVIQKDPWTLMFRTALFTIARIRKQPVSINTCMDKEDVVHVYYDIL